MTPNHYRFDNSLGYLTGTLSRLILARNIESFAFSGLAITADQWIVLIHVWAHEGIPQKAVADHMQIDKGSFTRIVTSLERAGMLYRRQNPADAREKFMYLTGAGKAAMDEATGLVQEVLEKSYTGIDPDHLDICRAVLKQAYLNLK